MIKDPLISIVTVCLNSEQYIDDCIRSVVFQNYANYEYIVIDGGSTDRTTAIIKSYSDKISYWHSRKDQGLSDAFNLGIEQCKGKWILFLNADDYLASPTVLSRIENLLIHWSDADVVLGQVMLMSRESVPITISGPHGGPIKWHKLRFQAIIPHQAAFTNKRFFASHGKFDKNYKTIMDYEFFLRGGSEINIRFCPIVVSHMRDGGLSKKNMKKSLRDIKNAQIQTHALPPLIAEINRLYLYSRYLLGNTIFGKPWRQFRNYRMSKINRGQCEKFTDFESTQLSWECHSKDTTERFKK